MKRENLEPENTRRIKWQFRLGELRQKCKGVSRRVGRVIVQMLEQFAKEDPEYWRTKNPRIPHSSK